MDLFKVQKARFQYAEHTQPHPTLYLVPCWFSGSPDPYLKYIIHPAAALTEAGT